MRLSGREGLDAEGGKGGRSVRQGGYMDTHHLVDFESVYTSSFPLLSLRP